MSDDDRDDKSWGVGKGELSAKFHRRVLSEGSRESSTELLRRVREYLKSSGAVAPDALSTSWGNVADANFAVVDIVGLRRQVAEQAAELEREQSDSREKQKRIDELQENLKQLQERERLSVLLSRVSPVAQAKLLSSPAFREQFRDDSDCVAFVMSVDIRRSTELMLKARTPAKFARFISDLCDGLAEVIKSNNGVFDKFTGDGVLAFFPTFFSGQDAGLSVIKAASECHRLFEQNYFSNRSSFSTVLQDVGLGIGIDYGEVRLLEVAQGLTVVGEPVVYACRFSGAPSGTTLVNQPAFEQLHSRFSSCARFSETVLDVKHEGSVLAYSVELTDLAACPSQPEWSKDVGGGTSSVERDDVSDPT